MNFGDTYIISGGFDEDTNLMCVAWCPSAASIAVGCFRMDLDCSENFGQLFNRKLSVAYWIRLGVFLRAGLEEYASEVCPILVPV